MSEQEIKVTKTELLKRIRDGRAELEGLLMKLTETQMMAPNVQERWSIKDMLAHIAAWERLTVTRLRSALTGEPLKIPPIGTDEEIDAYNAKVFTENKNSPLHEVRAEFESAHQEIYALVESLEEEFLLGPLPFEWAEGRPVWPLIVGNTFGHYPEHTEAIENWLNRRN